MLRPALFFIALHLLFAMAPTLHFFSFPALNELSTQEGPVDRI